MANKNLRRLTHLAVLSPFRSCLSPSSIFPIFPAAAYLEYDPADIPIFIATFLFGPWYGLLMTVVVSLIQGLTVSAGSGWVGILMHIFATGGFCIVAGLLYQKHKTKKRAVLALACGCLTMVVTMVIWNIIFTPIFNPAVTFEQVAGMLLPIIIPFNLIKAGANAIITFFLYKSVGNLIKKNL